jgi:exodeoxyribonuclease VII small subunit
VPKKQNDLNFEKSLQELEALVEKMETGDLSLEESLKCFERGVALTRNCQKALQEAEQKVQILLEKDGKQGLQDIDAEDNNS